MKIIYEDNHLLVVNKAVGEIVQQDKTGDDSLVEIIKKFLIRRDKRTGDVFLVPVHRLDRPTSGVVIFARTSKALSRMATLFQSRDVEKHYWAICGNQPDPPEGTLEDWVKKNEKKNMSFVVPEGTRDAKKARLTYRLVGSSDRYSLVDIDLQTGRHHQIRVQLGKIGCPVRGDLKYGYPRSNRDGGINLHARSVSFVHPVKKEKMTIVADPPSTDLLWGFFSGAAKPCEGE